MKTLLNSKQIREYLNIEKTQFYRLLQDETFPAFKVCGRWRAELKDLEEWAKGDGCTKKSGRAPIVKHYDPKLLPKPKNTVSYEITLAPKKSRKKVG